MTTTTSHIRIATRKSPLALWQANYVKNLLEQAHPYLTVSLVGIQTKADRFLKTELSKIGGKGLFIKELEDAMLSNEADIAVHSMKDVPAELPDGLCISTICERGEARDVLVSPLPVHSVQDLPQEACVGTSSLRRQTQLLALRPDLQVAFLRGNVNTRLSRLDEGDYDAIILAGAGLLRLGFEDRVTCWLEPDISLPAVGQGAIGIECRTDDTVLRTLLEPLNHWPTEITVTAERSMNASLGGNCHLPVAGFAVWEKNEVLLKGLVSNVNGRRIITHNARATIAQSPEALQLAHTLGQTVAQGLIDQGAGEILDLL